ncbi:metalloprotease [Coemansia sp. RSA 2598]|nr:metalloprotease [Coemansia sp. RSA 2598]
MNYTPGWHYSMTAREVDNVTIGDLQAFASRVFEETYVKMIVAGNFYEQDALKMAGRVEEIVNHIPLPMHMRITPLVHLFDPGYYVFRSPIADKDCKDNAIICQFQCTLGIDKFQNCVRFLLLKILSEPFYDQLRTKEQLGYIVYVTARRLGQAKGYLSFEIQGEYSPVYLTMRIDSFLREFRQKLVDLEQSKLDTIIQSLIDSWKEDYKSISQETSDFWSYINSNSYEFDGTETSIKATSCITKNDLVEFWDRYINYKTATNYTRVDYQMWSSGTYFPDVKSMQTYSSGIIALHHCLVKNGLEDITLSQVASLVSSIEINDSVDTLLGKIKEICLERPDGKELVDKAAGEKSKVRVALEMCIDEKKHTFEFRSTNYEKYLAIGMTHLPNGCWLINDPCLFKAAQPLSGQTIPTRVLAPKYT